MRESALHVFGSTSGVCRNLRNLGVWAHSPEPKGVISWAPIDMSCKQNRACEKYSDTLLVLSVRASIQNPYIAGWCP